MNWSVIHTKVACEFDVASRVTLLGFETFCPTFEKERHHNHRLERVTRPLFPRYLFAKFDRIKSDWGKIMDTKGVSDVLRDLSGTPYIVRDSVMDALRRFLATPAAANDHAPMIKFGDKVRLLEGPFRGFEGLFCEDANTRVMVMLNLFGRPTKVSIGKSEIAAIA